MTLLAIIAALMALVDLFNDPGKRVLPWWGDVVVMAGAGIYYIVSCLLIKDDD